MPKSKIRVGRLVSAIAICQLAGIVGSVFTFSAIPAWYASLAKPAFSPPNWIFGPVWLLLYTLMGISLYLVWNKGFKKRENRTALYLFGTQLALNSLWSILFFGLKNPFYALLEIIVLWIMIALTIRAFSRISGRAAQLLVPYILWVSFAAVLNFFVWRLNSGL